MLTIFDSIAPAVNFTTFALGLAPAQADNTRPHHPADSASLDEERARSIALAIAELETARRELEYDRFIEAENRAAYDRFMDELADERDAEARMCLICVA